ncbi:MAG: 50S ribosomal protein L22 [Nitrospirae bacterium]|nr:50S ribosomal protein L22 [Nitrospirota bacterium]MBI3606324.1 50S ribosomal protein L22 [Nitrospirota bacterium]
MAEARAILRHVHIPPRKVRLIVDLIRGQRVEMAMNTLRFLPQHAAKTVEKLLKSAVSNAEQKEMGDVDDLFVSEAYVNVGPVMKRFQPRAMGRAFRIHKRMSHITLVLSEQTEKKKETEKKS